MTFIQQNGIRGKNVFGRYAPFSLVGLREGVVIAVHYTDQPSNLSKTHVEYDVQDSQNGYVYSNVVRAASSGHVDGGEENVLKPAKKIVNSVEPLQVPGSKLVKSDGDRVLIGFVNASVYHPVIVGVAPHRLREAGRTTTLDGHRRYLIHEGTTFEVQKDGTYIVSRTLPTGVMSFSVAADGAFEVTHPSGSRVRVQIDGTVELEGSNGDSIRLGASASEHAVKGDAFKVTFDALVSTVNATITALLTHTHDPVTNLPIIGAPPTPAASMPVTNLSEKVVIE